jgi:uncharacterized protein DUF4082
MRLAVVLLLALATQLPAQTPFETHLEGLRVIHETQTADLQAAITAAAAATAALTVAQAEIVTLQTQVAALTTQVAALSSQVATLTTQLADCQNPPPPVADVTIWAPTDTPATIDFADPGAYEIGFKFKSSVAGNVKGVRFYKAAANVGTHVGHLWNTAGSQLAAVTFTGETASGWQQMLFAAPVAITANTIYVASVHMPSGHYSATVGGFTNAVTNGVLTAVADSESPNGVYKSGASGFPNTNNAAPNYWVDVVFNAGTASAPTRLRWNAPVVNANGSPCTDLGGYRIAWGAAPGTYGAPLDVGNVLELPFSSLPSGQNYYVALAYDVTGNASVWHAPLLVTVP